MAREASAARLQPSDLGIGRLFDTARDAVIVADSHGIIVLWNPAAAATFGWTQEEAVGQPLEILIPDRLRARHRAGIARWRQTGRGAYIESGSVMEFPALRKDGREMTIQMTLSAIDGEDVPGTYVAAIIRDVTEQRRLEARARELALIVQTTNDAIIGKRADGTVFSWNPAAERLYGFTADEIVGRPVIGTIIPPDREAEEREVLARVLAGEATVAHETERLTKDGRRIIVSMTASPIRDEHGAIVGESEIERDVSDRRLAERERRLALERLARIGQLEQVEASRNQMLRTATHELRTPLTVLVLQLQMLRAAMPEADAQQRRVLDVLERNVARLARLVQDIVDVARLQAGTLLQTQPTDLATVARDAVASFRAPADAAGVALDLEAEEGVVVEADPQRLGQVLDNLVGNALKFTPPGGRVAVRVLGKPGVALLEVQDTGAGLTPDQRAQLFQPFIQVHGAAKGGSGLGLFIAKGIVKQHRGSIGAESAGPGQGSRFWVRLPRAATA